MNDSIKKHLAEQMGIDDPELQQELYTEYCSSVKNIVGSLPEALDKTDYPRLRHLAHSLKGCAQTIGDTQMKALALPFEDSAKSENGANCRLILEELTAAADRL